jgi:hypothetical protein
MPATLAVGADSRTLTELVSGAAPSTTPQATSAARGSVRSSEGSSRTASRPPETSRLPALGPEVDILSAKAHSYICISIKQSPRFNNATGDSPSVGPRCPLTRASSRSRGMVRALRPSGPEELTAKQYGSPAQRPSKKTPRASSSARLYRRRSQWPHKPPTDKLRPSICRAHRALRSRDKD